EEVVTMTCAHRIAAVLLLVLALPVAAPAWERGQVTTFATLPPGAAHPEGITVDGKGNVYVTTFAVAGTPSGVGQMFVYDSRGRPQGGTATAWVQSPLLTTTGVPPFGANGLAFNNAGDTLFVCNTGNDTVVRVPVTSGGAAGTPSVFVNSVNGCDGLIIDEQDNLWLAANQADEIVVVNPSGRAIAKLGDFGGIDAGGAPIGLLFPASLVRSGGFIYVTNLAPDRRPFGLAPPVGHQRAAHGATLTG